MSVTAEKVAELLALPSKDRAYLAHELIRSLEGSVFESVETDWDAEIDKRLNDMEAGIVDTRSEEEMIEEIQGKLDAARRKTS